MYIKTKLLLACGVVAGPLFVSVLLALQAYHANYKPLRHPVSALSLGELGWMQVTNFLVAGLFLMGFAVGVRRTLWPASPLTWGPMLIWLVGLGLIGAGIFIAAPLNGQPPVTYDEPRSYGTVTILHDLFSGLAFFSLPAGCFVFARRFMGWGRRVFAVYSASCGVVFLVAFILASVAFRQAAGLGDRAGLFQRITIGIGLSWVSVLAIYLLTTYRLTR
jgi:hypothetical membrane protein